MDRSTRGESVNGQKIIETLNSIYRSSKYKPKRILLDNSTEFVFKATQDWVKASAITWDFSSPYHYESTG